MEQERLQALRRIATGVCQVYFGHREYDDLVQVAWLGAWRAVTRYQGPAPWWSVARHAARWSLVTFFEEQSLYRYGRRASKGRNGWAVYPAIECQGLPPNADALLVEDDFAPELIERTANILEGQAFWNRAERVLPRDLFQLLWEVVGQGRAMRRVAAERGWTPTAVLKKRDLALALLDAALGRPERHEAYKARERRDQARHWSRLTPEKKRERSRRNYENKKRRARLGRGEEEEDE